MTYAVGRDKVKVNGPHLLIYRISMTDDICGDDQTLHLTDYHVSTRPVGLPVMMVYTRGTSSLDLHNEPKSK